MSEVASQGVRQKVVLSCWSRRVTSDSDGPRWMIRPPETRSRPRGRRLTCGLGTGVPNTPPLHHAWIEPYPTPWETHFPHHDGKSSLCPLPFHPCFLPPLTSSLSGENVPVYAYRGGYNAIGVHEYFEHARAKAVGPQHMALRCALRCGVVWRGVA